MEKFFIDEKLLKFRNCFAHGDNSDPISPDDAIKIADDTIALIDRFKNIIDNALIQKAYLANP